MPGSIQDTLFDVNSESIREELGRRAIQFLPRQAPVFRDMILGSMDAGVEFMNAHLGRDLQMKQRFHNVFSGVIRGGQTSDFFQLVGDKNTTVGAIGFNPQANQTVPNPLDQMSPKGFGLTTTLYGVDTNLLLSATMMRLDATKANIREHVMPQLRGHGALIAKYVANAFYADPDKQYRLGSLGPSAGDGNYVIDGTAKTITFEPPEETTFKFQKGMEVDVFKDATTRANEIATVRTLLWVLFTDDWTNTVVIGVKSDDTTFATWGTIGNLAEDSFVVPANAFTTTFGHRGPYSWRSWAVGGGVTDAENRILRDQAITTTANDVIDIRIHEQFKSGFFGGPLGSSGAFGALTERKFMTILSRTRTAFLRYGYDVDTWLAADGIWESAFDQYQSRERFNRTGDAPSSVMGGLTGGFTFQHGDKVNELFSDLMMDKGVLLGMRRKKNWALVSPPSEPRSQKAHGQLQSEELSPLIPIEFTMPNFTGTDSVVFPVLKTGDGLAQPTEYLQMPGVMRLQFIPVKQIPMVVVEGVTDNKVYAA